MRARGRHLDLSSPRPLYAFSTAAHSVLSFLHQALGACAHFGLFVEYSQLEWQLCWYLSLCYFSTINTGGSTDPTDDR